MEINKGSSLSYAFMALSCLRYVKESIVANIPQMLADAAYYTTMSIPVRYGYVRDLSIYSRVCGVGYWFCISGATIHKNYLGEWANLSGLLATGRVTELSNGMVHFSGPVFIVPRIVSGFVYKGGLSCVAGLVAGLVAGTTIASGIEWATSNDRESSTSLFLKYAICIVTALTIAYKTWNALEWVFPTRVSIWLYNERFAACQFFSKIL